VQAIESSTVTAIEGRRFAALLSELPELANELLRETATGLRDATVRLHCLMNADATTRMADRLVHLADDSAGRPGGCSTIELPVSQEELGEWAGLSRAAAVKALRGLRRSGVIATGRMRIEILDLHRLCDIAAV
jgi:CRP-like cAMP-binding protein